MNAQNYQAEAIEKLENGELDSYEAEFVKDKPVSKPKRDRDGI